MNPLHKAVDDYLEMRRGLGFKLRDYGTSAKCFLLAALGIRKKRVNCTYIAAKVIGDNFSQSLARAEPAADFVLRIWDEAKALLP
jgi:hypothetical protein